MEKRLNTRRVRILSEIISPYLEKGEKVLDVGCGNFLVSRKLMEMTGANIIGIDVKDRAIDGDVLIYDGKKLPFEDDSFDTCLVLMVLHHCSDPSAVLKECKRVAKNRIIITEDIFSDPISYSAGFILDVIANAISGHFDIPRYLDRKKIRVMTEGLGLEISESKTFDIYPMRPGTHLFSVLKSRKKVV